MKAQTFQLRGMTQQGSQPIADKIAGCLMTGEQKHGTLRCQFFRRNTVARAGSENAENVVFAVSEVFQTMPEIVCNLDQSILRRPRAIDVGGGMTEKRGNVMRPRQELRGPFGRDTQHRADRTNGKRVSNRSNPIDWLAVWELIENRRNNAPDNRPQGVEGFRGESSCE